MTRHSLEQRWAYDLSSMLQVSLIAFMTAGLATTSSYFDLSYQLMAMCLLLAIITSDQKAKSLVRENAAPALSVASGQNEVAAYQ